MRKVMMTLVVVGALAFTIAAGPTASGATEHKGCKGIDQAFSRASAKGKEALTVVSEKFGCGAAVPDPVDPVACPSTSPRSLGRSAYTAEWMNIAGTEAGVTLNASHDNGGFYWFETTSDAVQAIVMQNTTGDVRTITDADFAVHGQSLDPGQAVSHNWFPAEPVNQRTGFALINFCGSPPDDGASRLTTR